MPNFKGMTKQEIHDEAKEAQQHAMPEPMVLILEALRARRMTPGKIRVAPEGPQQPPGTTQTKKT